MSCERQAPVGARGSRAFECQQAQAIELLTKTVQRKTLLSASSRFSGCFAKHEEKNMDFFKVAALAFAISAGLAPVGGFAQTTGSSGEFTIYNDTSIHTLTGFYTNDGDGWSANWISVSLAPGEAAVAGFYADTGACDQDFMAGWLSESGDEVLDEPHYIDICEASNVYLMDNNVEFD
ncbi:MAG: hypothetical protein ACJAQW_001457 [Paracoccaceae bacterium]|jgi:hypothetical protein